MKGVRSLKISISGVRGVVGESLTPGLLVRFAESFGTYVGGGKVVVGRDTRTSGEMAQHAALAGLTSAGCQAVLVDISPVPTIQLAVRQLRAAGGIAITASHNPAEWNAFKFIREDGCFLNSFQARELLDIYHQGDYAKARSDAMKEPKTHRRAVEKHIDAIMNSFGPLPVSRRRPVKVVVDCVNGAGSVMSPFLLKKLGCDVVAINATPDGIFPRPPEPLPENLAMLSDAVLKHKADIGFAQDADADRLAIVSELGAPIGEDYTLGVAVDHILSKTAGTVVTTLATSSAVDDIAIARGCRVVKSMIGEINVTETMKSENAVIGGEGNGGVIYPEVNFARDSFVGMAIALHYFAGKKGPVSEVVAALPRYHMAKTATPCPAGKALEVLELLIEKNKNRKIDLTEGIKISDGKKWTLVRPSNTEPIMRIISEAPTADEARRLNEKLVSQVNSFINDND